MTDSQIAIEDANRKQIARGLAARTAAFEAAQQPIVAVEEKATTSLAARLRQLATPKEVTRAARTTAHDALARIIPTGDALLARYNAAKAAIGDRAQDYAAIPFTTYGHELPPILQAIPPKVHPGQDFAWNHFAIKMLVTAARDISTTLASETYGAFVTLTNVMRQFESGVITGYLGADPGKPDRFSAIPNIGTALRTYEEALPKFKNVVDALEQNIAIVERNEALVVEDLATATATPIEAVPQQAVPVHQKLPLEAPRNYHTDFDPREPAPVPDTSVKVEAVADGYHITTTQRRAE
jgi:hypothetical protein